MQLFYKSTLISASTRVISGKTHMWSKFYSFSILEVSWKKTVYLWDFNPTRSSSFNYVSLTETQRNRKYFILHCENVFKKEKKKQLGTNSICLPAVSLVYSGTNKQTTSQRWVFSSLGSSRLSWKRSSRPMGTMLCFGIWTTNRTKPKNDEMYSSSRVKPRF